MNNKDEICHDVDVWRRADLLDYIMQELEGRVKRDNPTKKAVLHVGLSMFSVDPMVLGLKGPSGIGKTFTTMETLKLFPQDSIWYLYGCTRKSLVHSSKAVLLDENGEPFEYETVMKPRRKDHGTEEEFKEAMSEFHEQKKQQHEKLRKAYYYLDLTGVLLVFMDAPDYSVLSDLKPILSHDKLEAEYQFVDRPFSGSPMQTIRVKIHNWPAAIFLSTDRQYIEEFSTRMFTATPESSSVKFLEANCLTTWKNSMPWTYDVETQAFKTISALLARIGELAKQEHMDVIIPFLNLHDIFPHDQPRDMRDYTHFCRLVKTTTLPYYFQRPYFKIGEKKFLVATIQDVKESLELYRSVFETTRTGTEARTLDFYHKVLAKPDENGELKETWFLKEATHKYNETATKKLSEESVRVMMKRLDDIGYIDTEDNPKDKRQNEYHLLHKKEDEKAKNVLEQDFTLVLKPQLEKGFTEWLDRCPRDMPFYYMKNSDAEHWGEAEITQDELKSSIVKGGVLGEFDKPLTKPKAETNPKIKQTDETRRILDKSANFLWRRVPTAEKCELCGQFAVEYEVNNIRSAAPVRRCEPCFRKMRSTYKNAVWKEVAST